ncbi:tetratricopeptide repeat protein [Allokutzneria sp. NRRL B-24872]|uniref:tetratricopeptide repeat protein n=1 Tax=Allokutzneria sp. NRRL B-24872 TaxID=1137961 RepID=UPI001AEF9507|nr:tetratricopeptide repeat protein [Allokutzneria sp. NRRL B-24872]
MRELVAQSYVSFLEGDMDTAAMTIGTVTGVHPSIAWAAAPWFNDERFLSTVSLDALAEGAMRTMDRGHDLNSESMRARFQPWFRAIDVVSARRPQAEAMAKMAILLRACGLTDASFALCDQADSVERVMLTEVVRAGTWRKLGDAEQTTAAFERAVALDPTNWSLHLDLADTHAAMGDFAAAVRSADQGLEHEPSEVTLRAARAAYRTRLTGSAVDLSELVELAPLVPNDTYRDVLIDHACAGPDLPAELVAAARDVQDD